MLRMKIAYYANSHSTEFIARQSFIGASASSALNLVITTLGRDLLTPRRPRRRHDPARSRARSHRADFRARRRPRRAQDQRQRAQDHGQGIPGQHGDHGIAAGNGAGHTRRQGVHARRLHARASGARDRGLRARGQQAVGGRLAHQPADGNPRRLRHRRRRALRRPSRDLRRTNSGRALLVHHLGDHELRADEAARALPRRPQFVAVRRRLAVRLSRPARRGARVARRP